MTAATAGGGLFYFAPSEPRRPLGVQPWALLLPGHIRVPIATSSEGFPNVPASSASCPCQPSSRRTVRSGHCRRARRRSQSHQPGHVGQNAVSREPRPKPGEDRARLARTRRCNRPAASSFEDRRWCYEHIPPTGNRAEMLRIRNEPSRGVYIDALFYYMVDYDLDGLIDVGSTTQIEAVDRQNAHADRTCHRVFLSQHEARRPVPRQLPEDVRRGHPNRAEVFRRMIACDNDLRHKGIYQP